MIPRARYKPSTDFSPACIEFMAMAERELSAFFNAVTQSFGSDQAELSAEDWLRELIEMDDLPTSVPKWRSITLKASTLLASRVRASSPSPESQIA